MSKDGKKLLVQNLKPNEYKMGDDLFNNGDEDTKKQQFLSKERRKEELRKKFKKKDRINAVVK